MIETDRAEQFANKPPERANSQASVHTKQTGGHILREKKRNIHVVALVNKRNDSSDSENVI